MFSFICLEKSHLLDWDKTTALQDHPADYYDISILAVSTALPPLQQFLQLYHHSSSFYSSTVPPLDSSF